MLTFDQEFDTVSYWNATYNPSGMWRDNYGYGGINNYTLPGESELYAGPYFNGHPGDFNDGNYVLSGGVLSLTAHATTNTEVTGMGYSYDSGMITTRGLEPWFTGGPTAQFSQEYGYFEMRAKIATDPGTWNAFWMLPAGGTSSGWNSGEVDIMESVGKENGLVWQATHGATDAGAYASGVNVDDGQFHTFALDWTDTTLTWYVDGVATRTEATPTDMHQAYTIFANLALGGSWAGPIDLSATGGSDALQIDYIKAWDSDPYTATPVSPPPPPPPPPAGMTLSGTNGADTLTGGDGPDTIYGGSGNDSIVGLGGNDFLQGNKGDDGIQGGPGDDTIYGGAGQDLLHGGQGDDVLYGDRGSDVLYGDLGNDTLTGGAGMDRFVFGPGDGHDVITDFDPRYDLLDVTPYGADHGVAAQVGADTVVTFGTGDTITLSGVNLAAMHSWNWIFS